MSNMALSMDSLHLTQGCNVLSPLSLRRKLTDIMFVFDIINLNIVYSDLPLEISF